VSLRAFHLLFIVLSAALAVFMGAWAAGQYRVQHDIGYVVVVVAALASAGGLVAYALAFRRKTRHL
jgi:hypothetical protein